MRTLAHINHEAVQKVGGIGAVLEGLLTSAAYRDTEQRTILVGPLFATEGGGDRRLGPTGEVLYSSLDGVKRHPISEALDHVRRDFHVGIVYGHRTFTDPATQAQVSPEVVLIDVSRMHASRVNGFKGGLWEHFGIDSKRYESSWEYELYVKLAEPALAVLHALGAVDSGDECVILAHEFMGMPTALGSIMHPSKAFRSIFYAHEVSTIRRIVEHHPGHDVAFYNLMALAKQEGRYVEDLFGDQHHYYRHVLVEASRHCDAIFAVGDDVAEELRFLHPEFADTQISVTYNGIPAEQITLEQKRVSGDRLRDYAKTLLGDRPDYVFTHVTRTAVSKGLWRDVSVLECLEQAFRKKGQSAVLFLLSTELPPRSPEDVRDMEKWWHWPVAHREGDPDLSDGEALVYQAIQEFNACSRRIKIVYVNQFGWESGVCGERMPADMEFLDIRRGSDVEFGQSVYEPFGIAQLEPLTYGGICVVSDVCGCAGFSRKVGADSLEANVIIADYTNLGKKKLTHKALVQLDRRHRHRYETQVARRVARQLLDMLPADDKQTTALLESGYALASRMSWDVVARNHVLPQIEAVCQKYPRLHVA